MSIKNLFKNNKQLQSGGKYLKKSSLELSGSGLESQDDLAARIEKENNFVPFLDYSDPENFVKFGSAEKYYNNAFTYITNYYPYDGSGYEKTKFFNELNPLERYIFDEKYPRSTGYIIIGNSYGSVSGSHSGTSVYNGYFSSSAEYLEVKGGPHTNTVFSTGSNRRSNLEFGGLSGSTIEFLFKKDTGIPSASVSSPHTPIQSENQVIFDLYNGASSGSDDYGRVRIEIRSGSEDRFYVTMQSGTSAGFLSASVPSTGGLSLTGGWKHYGFAFNPNGTSSYDLGALPTIDFYVNGNLYERNIISSGTISTTKPTINFARIGKVTGTMIANIGALRTAPSGAVDSSMPSQLGWGKLSASIDEFRFWKGYRNSKDIGRYWFDHVNGGTDKYDANEDLGVYFKFNEGITDVTQTDKVFLDYSGRVSNGQFRGYQSYTRNTGSAVNEMSLTSVREPRDLVVRSTNPTLITEQDNLERTGREYDYENSAHIMKTMPDWIWDQDSNSGNELYNMTQIMASYFDTLHSQITVMNQLKNVEYISGSITGSINEFPYNEKLLSSMGFETPELFGNIDAFERYFDRDEDFVYDQSIEKVRNVVYRNIYNNLQDIMKAKGNEKAIRNLIRCFGIDESIVSLRTYSNNSDFDLLTNYSPVISKKKYIDFSGFTNSASSDATVYQYYNNLVTSSVGILSGNARFKSHAITVQGEFIFPDKQYDYLLSSSPPLMVSSSLFGFHHTTASVSHNHDLTWIDANSDRGLQVYAVKTPSSHAEITYPKTKVKDVKFVVKNRNGDTVLTSSVFQNVYDNSKWNLALSVFPEQYPYALELTGTNISNYTLSLYGANYDSDLKRNSFYATASLSQLSGGAVLTGSKRFYLGAHRTNFSGALLIGSDIKASSFRVWNSLLPTGTVDLHALEGDTYGTVHPYRQAYTFQGITSGSATKPQNYIPTIETLALNWDFANITGSDASGRFDVADFSSGSTNEEYIGNYQGNEFSQINRRQLTGRGDFFATSSSDVVGKEFFSTLKKQFPEQVFSEEMITLTPGGDVQAFKPQQRPTNFYFSLEKSLYASISERMLEFFASIDEFNNLIGEPVNKYRPNYKSMEKLREIFFRRVGSDMDFDKYVRYYKWIDNSISSIAERLFPASANYKPGIKTIIESHVLERPKVKYVFAGDRTQRRETAKPLPAVPSTDNRSSNNNYIEGAASPAENRAPVGANRIPINAEDREQTENENPWWWKKKAKSSNPNSTSGDTIVDAQRDTIKTVSTSGSRGYNGPIVSMELGGIRRGNSKRKTLESSNTNQTPVVKGSNEIVLNSFVPSQTEKFNNLPNRKKVMPFSVKKIEGQFAVVSERTNSESKLGRKNVPFSAISSSILTGYRTKLSSSGLVNTEFANLHYDSYGGFGKRSPMQGPFTDTHVGGVLSRHNSPLRILNGQFDTSKQESFEWSFAIDANATDSLYVNDGYGALPGFDSAGINGATLGIVIDGVTYHATVDNTVAAGSSNKTTIGVNSITGSGDILRSIKTSIDNSISADSLPVTTTIAGISLGSGPGIDAIVLTHADFSSTINGNQFTGSFVSASLFGADTGFSGGSAKQIGLLEVQFAPLKTKDQESFGQYNIPQGKYLRGPGAKRPVNIKNIASATGSESSTLGVKRIGNYTRNYEVLMGSDRSKTNVDFAFHSSEHYSGKIPSAFLTTDARRTLGLTGSVDFANRRQQTGSVSVASITPAAVSSINGTNGKTVTLTMDGISYAATIDKTALISASSATVIGTVDATGTFVNDLVRSIKQSLGTWIVSNNVPLSCSTTDGILYVSRTTQDSYQNGNVFAGTLASTGDATVVAFAGGTKPRRVNKTIFVSRFAAPGSKFDSKQQFRDIASDQMSPNNALPFRNVPIRQSLQSQLRTHVGWGGFKNGNITASLDPANLQLFNDGSGSHASIYKTQRNTTAKIRLQETSGYDGSGLFLSQSLTTGSMRDNGYISRPVPAADRNSWFVSLSGSGMTGSHVRSKLFDQYFVSGSRLPARIDVPLSPDVTNLVGTLFAGGVLYNARKTYNGKYNFLWAATSLSAPWSQTRVSQTRRGKNYKNIYQFRPIERDISTVERSEIANMSVKTDLLNTTAAGTSFTTNTLVDKYSERFVEPPVTSRYKPLVHKVMAHAGTPSYTDPTKTKSVLLEYSYGNNLQGFANKKINTLLNMNRKFASGLQKRPYEVLRDQYVNSTNPGISGIDRVNLMVYKETVYPREIYTYLSGTRARQVFTNDYWRADFQSQPPPGSSYSPGKSDISNDGFPVYGLTGSSVIVSGSTLIERYNLNLKRHRSPFTTSQGHAILSIEQYPEYSALGTYAPVGQPGTGSIWPMDSMLYRGYLHSDNGLFGMDMVGENAATIMGSTTAGELMLPWHGRFSTDITGSYLSFTGSSDNIVAVYQTSSIVSAQYVYTVPAEGVWASNAAKTFPSIAHPGGIFSRPEWTVGRIRLFVDGDNKGQRAPARYPFETSYDDYVKELRIVGKDHTIIPEYRISEEMEIYQTKGSVTVAATSSISLTGSSAESQNTANSEFISRYGTSDIMEYLGTFMKKGSDDLEFNKNPRHLSLETSAYMKLLPYNQFYPQTRVVELARMFSQSYGSYVTASCNDEKPLTRTKWRPLLRPFFAPGILLNSIKSGVAVQYPITRNGLNQEQFFSGSMGDVMAGGLSGTLDYPVEGVSGSIPGNRRRRKSFSSGNFDFTNSNVDKFFYGDVVPFEGILKPMEYVNSTLPGIMGTDTNPRLYRDITASILPEATQNDLLYRLAISNFLAVTPEFFLKQKEDGGYLTKFVAELPSKNAKANAQGTAPASQEDARKVEVKADTAYVMEIGLKKTDNFNMYNNPYAFGPPTSTGSVSWVTGDESVAAMVAAAPAAMSVYATTASVGVIPSHPNWPLHKGEFAPFTPTYYYGPSLVRITYMPNQDKDVSLNDILRGSETYVEFINSNGHHYDWASGSYIGESGQIINSGGIGPRYGWNRAWQNRQDIDASIVIDNLFPTEGAEVAPMDPNKWVIMPKWECPVLDFPKRNFNYPLEEELLTGNYDYSQSVDVVEGGDPPALSSDHPHTGSTFGMWHQSGLMPNQNEGIFLYLSDVSADSTEQRLCGDFQYASSATNYFNLARIRTVKKISKFVVDSGRQISSLARLVGFKDEEIMPPNQFLPERAKRIGELADDGEKTISEAILAIPYYLDGDTDSLKTITLSADGEKIGPKLKEFRRSFTKYSLPPSLRSKLVGLLPENYPQRRTYINPFGDDDYEKVLDGTDILQIPVMYLFEHSIALNRQDLADIWQGVLPDIGSSFRQSVVGIDHYMPGDQVEGENRTIFPEILDQELSLGIPRDGHPRVDLLDIASEGSKNGFHPEIRWLVFKVKQRGQTNYTKMVMEEINDGALTFSSENAIGFLSETLPPQLAESLKASRDLITKNRYHSEILGAARNTYNWPYDFCSVIELAKMTATVGFRPDLEVEESDQLMKQTGQGSAERLRVPTLPASVTANVSEVRSVMPLAPVTQQILSPEKLKPLPPVIIKKKQKSPPKIPLMSPAPPFKSFAPKGQSNQPKVSLGGMMAGYNLMGGI